MANGGITYAFAQPDIGNMSPEQYLQQREQAEGVSAGGTEPVQPPPPPAGMPTTVGGWAGRYGKAALEGAAPAAGIAAAEAAYGPAGWAAAPVTIGLGAVGGLAGQGAEDLWRYEYNEEPPWWVGPAAGTVASLGVSGLPAAGRALSQGVRSLSSVFHGGGGFAGGLLADHIIDNAGHLLGNAVGDTKLALIGAGATLGAGVGSGLRNLTRSSVDLMRPVVGMVGGMAPRAINPLLPGGENAYPMVGP